MKENQPSATARMIARSLLLLSQDPARSSLTPPWSAETTGWFLNACGEDAAHFRVLAGRSWFRRALNAVESLAAPGIMTHYVLRKRQIEDAVRAALASGAAQVVVLGAGFDTLALRLHDEFPAAAFWELDHPATQAIKCRTLQVHATLGENLHFVTLDFAAGRLADALLFEPHYDQNAATVFVAEGLLMYLAPQQVAEVFQDAHTVSGPDSVFAFTFLEPQANGQVEFDNQRPIISWWLKRRGEPFCWGLKGAEVTQFLDAHGWDLQQTLTPLALRRLFLGEAVARPITGDLVGFAVRI